jgi:hypothetical protein
LANTEGDATVHGPLVWEAPMFGVEYVFDDQWKIIDENDKVVFVGTIRQAEDWLDFRENAKRQTVSIGVWLRNRVATVRRLLARPFADRPPQPGSRLTLAEFRRRARKH